MNSQPDTNCVLALHARACDGDADAAREVALLVWDHLARGVRGRFPQADEHLVMDGLVDALRRYEARPGWFNPDGGSTLAQFLFRAACWRVGNRLRGERRHQRHEQTGLLDRLGKKEPVQKMSVELVPCADYLPVENEKEGEDGTEARRRRLDEWLAELSREERAVLDLMRRGVRATEVYAAALGCGHLPVKEQRRVVKRAKDRLMKYLRRRAGRTG